jgi:hypothetical protein
VTDDRTAVAAAIAAVGAHRWVRVEVTDVSVVAGAVEIDMVIHYPSATPVCCGEPSCYIGFLGQHRKLLPAALGAALNIPPPAVTLRAQLRYEPGYRHIDHRTGTLVGPGIDQLVTYEPTNFL